MDTLDNRADETETTIKMTITVPASTRQRLKIQAAREGRNLSNVALDAFFAYLAQHEPPSG